MKKTILLFIGFVFCICLWGCSAKTVSSLQSNNDDNIYENKQYDISLSYNKDWKPNNQYDNRYEGKDGFFQISAYDGGNSTIDEVADDEAAHKLKPYGSNPLISEFTIQGQDARLIMPSDDQGEEYKNQAEIIVKYPKNIEINGKPYSFLLLYADKNNIEKIGKTIKFILS